MCLMNTLCHAHQRHTHTQSVNGSSSLLQGGCVHPTRNMHKEERSQTIRGSKRQPSHSSTCDQAYTLVILSTFEADNILVALLFQLQPQKIFTFLHLLEDQWCSSVTLSFSLYPSSAIFPHRPWKLELFLKCFLGLQSSRQNYLSFTDWKCKAILLCVDVSRLFGHHR